MTSASSSRSAAIVAMGKLEGSSQLLTGEARGGHNGVIVVGLSSEPQIVEAFFDSWDGSDEYDRDAFVNELMQRDLMLFDLQACFISMVPGASDARLETVIPDKLRGEIVYVGLISCLEGEEEQPDMMVQDWNGSVVGLAASDVMGTVFGVMINGTRQAFTEWSLKLFSESPLANDGGRSGLKAGNRTSDPRLSAPGRGSACP